AELDRLWHVRAERVVLATGTREILIAFADNDRPGVMLSKAAADYLRLFGVAVGMRIASFSSFTYFVTLQQLREHAGAELVAAIDVRQDAPRTGDLSGLDVPVLAGWTVVGTAGTDAITAVQARGPDGETRTIECDALLVSG